MSYRYEVEVTITSAKDLKNINWRQGPLKPYAVLWVDPKSKCSTRVDDEGDTCPYWNETLLLPFNSSIEDSTLYVDIVHSKTDSDEDIKPLIGSARLPLHDVVDDVGLGHLAERRLELKRPSGRPHGKLELKVNVREPRYRAPEPYYAPPYGIPPPAYRDFEAPQPPYGGYGSHYAAPPPPSGYAYGAPAYGQASYGGSVYGGYEEEKKKSKYGMGTGLAVGAVAGVLGGLALAEGVDYVEDKIEDDVAEKVEDDLGYDDGDF